jgi:hypothetical protein
LFIEVSDGISINTDFIEKVVSTTHGCEVYANGVSYPSVFPYRLLLSLIRDDKEEVAETKEVRLDKDAMNALNSLGHHFAG